MESNHPLVSVVITTCNRSKMLRECLESIFASQFHDFEVIVINDASKDDTDEVIKEFLHRVKYVKNEIGEQMIRSRNKGARYSKGKYLIFIDDDNVIHPEMIGHLVSALNSDESIAVVGPMMFYNSDRNRIWWSQTVISRVSARTFFPYRNSMRGEVSNKFQDTDGIPNVFMVRKELFDKLGGFDNSYIDTWTEGDFGTQVQKKGYREVRVLAAETYHQVSPREFVGFTARSIGDNPIKAYTTIRNRYKWVGRHSNFFGKITFLLLWSWLILGYYIFSAIRVKRATYIPKYLKGVFFGIPLLKIFSFQDKDATLRVALLSKGYRDAVRLIDENINLSFQSTSKISLKMISFPYVYSEKFISRYIRLIGYVIYSVFVTTWVYFRYDVVHISSPHNYFWVHNIWLSKVFRKTKTILTVHHLDQYFLNNNVAKKGVLLRVLHSFDHYIAVSQFAFDQLIQIGLSKNKIDLIPNAISNSFEFTKSSNKIITDLGQYILYVGDEYPRKNLSVFLSAFKELLQIYPNLMFVKLGRVKSQSDAKNIDLEIEHLNLSKDVLIKREFVSNLELNEWYSRCLFTVSPSSLEGFGLPVIEACRCRAIPIVSAIPPYLEFNLPKPLYIENYTNANDWKSGIQRILETSDLERELIRSKVYEISLAYSYQSLVTKLKALYFCIKK